MQPLNASPAASLSASLPLPVGSTIYQLNAAFTATGPNAAIKIRGGSNYTHVVIDRIGWLV
ncbi:MAG: hypothetical protein ABIR32_15920 [Ilumatobacteraceae bacterium]